MHLKLLTTVIHLISCSGCVVLENALHFQVMPQNATLQGILGAIRPMK